MRQTNIISRCEGIYRQDKLKDGGLSACHHSYILAIAPHPGMTQDRLAKHICIDKSGVSRAVEELVQKGFVERKTSKDDRRYVVLTLLSKGQERFEKIENDMYLKFKEVLEKIPETKREQVVEALKLYNEACAKVEEK